MLYSGCLQVVITINRYKPLTCQAFHQLLHWALRTVRRLTADNVGLYEPPESPFNNFQEALLYIKGLARGNANFYCDVQVGVSKCQGELQSDEFG